MKAVEEGKFTIWAVDDVTDVLPLLLNLVWDGEGQTTLMQTIQERIAQASQQEGRHRFPWPLRWLNWLIRTDRLVQRTRVSYPACFNKIRLTENMVDKRESYTKEDLLASVAVTVWR